MIEIKSTKIKHFKDLSVKRQRKLITVFFSKFGYLPICN